MSYYIDYLEAGSQRLKKDESEVQKLVSTVLVVMTDTFCLENADDEDSCSLKVKDDHRS